MNVILTLNNGHTSIVSTGARPKHRMYWSGEIRIVSNGMPVVQPINSEERLHAEEMQDWVQQYIVPELNAEFPNPEFIKVTLKTSNKYA